MSQKKEKPKLKKCQRCGKLQEWELCTECTLKEFA